MMGYMDLSVMGSDVASDAAVNMAYAAIKSLEHSLKEKGNEYNTGGLENVAMIIDEVILPSKMLTSLCSPRLEKLVDKILPQLEKLINRTQKSEWYDQDNKKYHLTKYKRLFKRLSSVQNA
jgi:NADH:ubiquinone oxidoreductase subunit B-like Fe-S oxidoreductase